MATDQRNGASGYLIFLSLISHPHFNLDLCDVVKNPDIQNWFEFSSYWLKGKLFCKFFFKICFMSLLANWERMASPCSCSADEVIVWMLLTCKCPGSDGLQS